MTKVQGKGSGARGREAVLGTERGDHAVPLEVSKGPGPFESSRGLLQEARGDPGSCCSGGSSERFGPAPWEHGLPPHRRESG